MLTKKTLTQINTRSQRRGDLWQFGAIGAGVVFLATVLFSNGLALAAFAAGAGCEWAA